MRNCIFSFLLSLLFLSHSYARPISYSGGTTIMQSNNDIKNSLHIHYSPSYKYSLGYKFEYHKNKHITLNAIQLNNLINRWNMQEAQANIYLKSAMGNAHKSANNNFFTFTGIAADFETRKYFVSYANRYYASKNDLINYFEQQMRIGIAPYVANYGKIHSWLMLEFSEQNDNKYKKQTISSLIRVFKQNHLFELGYNSRKKILFNFITRF